MRLPHKTGLLVGYRVVSELVGRISTFLLILLTARWLTKEEFAVLSLALVTGWILSVASDFGMQIYLAREVAKTPELALEILSVLLRRRLLLSGLLFLALLAFAVVTGWPALLIAFLLVVLAQLTSSLIEFLGHFLRGLSRSDLESSFMLAYRPAALFLVVSSLLLNRTLTSLAVAMVFASLVGLIFALQLCRRIGAGAASAGKQALAPVLSSREFLPIGAGILLSTLYFRSDLYLIEWWRGLEAVALYSAVFRLIEASRLFPSAVVAVIFPRLCQETTKRMVITYGFLLGFCGLILTFVLQPLSSWVVTLAFGAAFGGAVKAFDILIWALPLLYLNFLLTHQLIAWGRQSYFAGFCGVGLVINLGLNLVLIPDLGIEGAAWSTVLTELLLTAAWIGALMKSGEVRQAETSR